MAFIKCSCGTRVDTAAERTGWPIAIKSPNTAALMVALKVEMLSVETKIAVTVVTKNAPIWLVIRISRRFIRSEKTPMGSEIKSAGTPITKRSKPLTSDFAPSSKISHTNAKRCVDCTSTKPSVLIHKSRNDFNLSIANDDGGRELVAVTLGAKSTLWSKCVGDGKAF